MQRGCVARRVLLGSDAHPNKVRNAAILLLRTSGVVPHTAAYVGESVAVRDANDCCGSEPAGA
jgi:hypothetical protein